MTPYTKPNTEQPDEITLAAIIDATRAEHAARSNAQAWQITRRAIRRWTRRRHMVPASVAQQPNTRQPAQRVRTRDA